MKVNKREVEVVVISDVHLGTYGCHAKELLQYLKSIKPKTIILNGDIIDIWQFSKKYWPVAHMQVIQYLMKLVTKGVKIYYITGNHDEMLRKFVGYKLGNLQVVNKLVLELDGQKAWIFHGDVFDVTMQHSKWLTKLGATGYDLLILINGLVNFISLKLGYGKISLSKKIKDSVKSAVKFINNFEETAAEIGIENGYKFVVCGHIHQPEYRLIATEKGEITYLNSGDWVENLTSLEYKNGAWSLYRYNEDLFAKTINIKEKPFAELTNSELFLNLVQEFKLKKTA